MTAQDERADWLQKQRWFFEKGLQVTGLETVWRHRILDDAGDIDLTIEAVSFANGSTSHYFIPVDVQTGAEAIASPVFASWLLRSLNDASITPADLQWTRIGTGLPSGTVDLPGQLMGVEQSNSSIRYGDQLMVKVNRRLTAGASPEAELTPVISRAADRSFAPEAYGTLWQNGALGAATCLAICTRYVPNVGDGWGFLRELGATDPAACVVEAAAIGDVTARMHNGLISDPWRAEVSPEPVRASDTARWTSKGLSDLDTLVAEIARRVDGFDVDARALADLLPAAVPSLRDRLAGVAGLVGTSQIRIHGDYHLGQVLRTADGAYVVVDFDGEPNRPLAERREKFPALRDVAGMMRSFAYLRGTLERADTSGKTRADWLAWEDELRAAFMAAYRDRLDTGDLRLVPEAQEELENGLTALELDKAIYEVGYEMATRPDWVALPLARLVRTR